MDLSPEGIVQGSIFEGQTRPEQSWELMDVIDALNQQFGSGTIRWAFSALAQNSVQTIAFNESMFEHE